MSRGGIVVSYKFKDIDINKVKTAEKVREFLTEEFQIYLNRAGKHRTDLSSPKNDPSGVTAHGGNSAESNMLQIFDYEAKCYAIYQTIQNCRQNPNKRVYDRQILYDLYIRELEDWQVAERIGISSSRLRAKKQSALCDFADRLPVFAYRNHVKFRDLRVYDNGEVRRN